MNTNFLSACKIETRKLFTQWWAYVKIYAGKKTQSVVMKKKYMWVTSLQQLVAQMPQVDNQDICSPFCNEGFFSWLQKRDKIWEQFLSLVLSPFPLLMLNKVSGPNSVIYLNGTPIFEWWVVRCRIKNEHQKDMWFKRDWASSSKCANHSKLNSQHNWGDLCDLLMAHC